VSEKNYQTPSSDLEKPAYIFNEGSSIRAIAYGILISIVGTFIVVLLYGTIYGTYLHNSGMATDEIGATITDLSVFTISGFVIFCLLLPVSVLSGYVCAKNSIFHIYRDTAIMFLIVWVTGSIIGYGEHSQTVGEQSLLVENIVTSLADLIATFLGAFLWQKKSL
jgi:hypothetical protein